MRIAILAVQGAFAEHRAKLEALGAECMELRKKEDLQTAFDGLVLPGGESTVQGKLLKELDMFDFLREKIAGGMPVLATCAGLILLAKEVDGGTPCFGTMDIAARRNAYGRQLGSFYAEAVCSGVGQIPMTFIRAPYIASVSGSAEALATVDGRIVAARQGNQLVTAFHPELNDSLAIHRLFLDTAAHCA